MKKIGKYIPPALLVTLAVSFAMWWLTQLGKSYGDVEIPVQVRVEGNIFDLKCYASGRGYRLAARRIWDRASVEIPFDELIVTPSGVSSWRGVIDPGSLHKAVASRIDDVEVGRIGFIPEISLRGR